MAEAVASLQVPLRRFGNFCSMMLRGERVIGEADHAVIPEKSQIRAVAASTRST